jgi:hypothetical protein
LVTLSNPGTATAQLRTSVGDPTVCYWNPEFSPDGRYAVWIEQPEGQSQGHVWHCAVDANTGALDPPDCKGFQAFDATVYGHANWGTDAEGPYYVGGNLQGQVVLVRPTSGHDGAVQILSTPPDTERRGFYASRLPGSSAGFVYFTRNATGVSLGQGEVELRYIDLASPAQDKLIARQQRSGGWAPLEVAYPRWFSGSTTLVYGVPGSDGHVQVAMVDVSQPTLAPVQITSDPHDKIDAFPFTYNNRRYLMAGVDRTSTSKLYAEGAYHRFWPVETVTPSGSGLVDPCLAQSNETYQFGGQLFTAYQISDCSSGNWFNNAPGEVWLSTLLTSPQKQWRLSTTMDTVVNNEPEPLVGSTKAWVFYSSYQAGQPDAVCPELWRVDVSSAGSR